MLFILDGTPGADVALFLARLQEETLSCSIILYNDWIQHANPHQSELACDKLHEHPAGIIFMRVSSEIAHKRLQNQGQTNISLDHIVQIYKEKEQFFIENKNNPKELQNLPVLVLNGNIDFQTDFAQFYNHLFYIRRFIKQLEEQQDILLGIHKEKPHRKCC